MEEVGGWDSIECNRAILEWNQHDDPTPNTLDLRQNSVPSVILPIAMVDLKQTKSGNIEGSRDVNAEIKTSENIGSKSSEMPAPTISFKLEEPLKDPGEDDNDCLIEEDSSLMKVQHLSRYDRLHYGISSYKRKHRHRSNDDKIKEEIEEVLMAKLNARTKSMTMSLPSVDLNTFTQWKHPDERAILISQEVCLSKLRHPGAHTVAKVSNSQVDVFKLGSVHAHVGHNRIEDPHHITCTVSSRPLRGIGKAEQSISTKNNLTRRLQELDETPLSYIKNTVFFDEATKKEKFKSTVKPTIRPHTRSPSKKNGCQNSFVSQDDANGFQIMKQGNDNMFDKPYSTGNEQHKSPPLASLRPSTSGISSLSTSTKKERTDDISVARPLTTVSGERRRDGYVGIHTIPSVRSKHRHKHRQKWKKFVLPGLRSKTPEQFNLENAHISNIAPGTPRAQAEKNLPVVYDTFVVSSRVLSPYEAEIPNDPLAWSESLWRLDKSKESFEEITRKQKESKSGVRPGTSGNQTVYGPMQIRGIMGCHHMREKSLHHWTSSPPATPSAKKVDTLRALYQRSMTPLYIQTLQHAGMVRSKLKSRSLMAIDVGGNMPRYQVEGHTREERHINEN